MNANVCFFHTVASLADRFEELSTEYIPEADHFHIVDESVLNDALEASELTPDINQRICSQLVLAEDAGADLILDTCSSTSPAVDIARQIVDVPILKIDDPMTETAVERGDHITVLATAASTLDPSTDLVRRKANQQGTSVTIRSELIEGALDAREHGKQDEHDQKITDRTLELADETDVIILAQASMSHLAPDLSKRVSVPVLSSPDMAMEAVAFTLENR